jgi:hypothetical protein
VISTWCGERVAAIVSIWLAELRGLWQPVTIGRNPSSQMNFRIRKATNLFSFCSSMIYPMTHEFSAAWSKYSSTDGNGNAAVGFATKTDQMTQERYRARLMETLTQRPSPAKAGSRALIYWRMLAYLRPN